MIAIVCSRVWVSLCLRAFAGLCVCMCLCVCLRMVVFVGMVAVMCLCVACVRAGVPCAYARVCAREYVRVCLWLCGSGVCLHVDVFVVFVWLCVHACAFACLRVLVCWCVGVLACLCGCVPVRLCAHGCVL